MPYWGTDMVCADWVAVKDSNLSYHHMGIYIVNDMVLELW